jgi:hypothetical protein
LATTQEAAAILETPQIVEPEVAPAAPPIPVAPPAPEGWLAKVRRWLSGSAPVSSRE